MMKLEEPDCQADEHNINALSGIHDDILENTVTILSAMADTARLNILILLHEAGESCVSALAKRLGDKTNTVSMRLKKLHDAGLVSKRRDAKHIFYSLKDDHIVTIVRNAIEHAQHHSQ